MKKLLQRFFNVQTYIGNVTLPHRQLGDTVKWLIFVGNLNWPRHRNCQVEWKPMYITLIGATSTSSRSVKFYSSKYDLKTCQVKEQPILLGLHYHLRKFSLCTHLFAKCAASYISISSFSFNEWSCIAKLITGASLNQVYSDNLVN